MKEVKNVKELIDMLHIDRIGEIEAEHRMIRERYRVRRYDVETFEEFKAAVVHYYQHHTANWLQTPSPMPPGIAEAQIARLLRDSPDVRLAKIADLLSKEQSGGYRAAVDNSITGRHGGLVAVIDAIAEAIKEKAVKRYVDSVFLDYIDPRDYDKKVALMQEYINTYGGVLLTGEECRNPHELACHIEAVIQNHVRLINEFRKTLQ